MTVCSGKLGVMLAAQGAGARLRREAEETPAGRGDAVGLAGEGEIFPDLAHAVVHPPDVAEHREHVAEVGLVHRRHGRGARRPGAQAAEVEEAAERIRRHLAEEVVEDRLRRAQRLVRDARCVPDEERLHAELRRARVRDAVEQGIQEPEQVAEMEGALRIVRRLQSLPQFGGAPGVVAAQSVRPKTRSPVRARASKPLSPIEPVSLPPRKVQ